MSLRTERRRAIAPVHSWVFATTLLLAAACAARAGEVVLTTLEPVAAEPGRFATFTCRLEHLRTNRYDRTVWPEVRVSFQPPLGWTALSAERTLVLPPGGDAIVPFVVQVPLHADPGTSHDAIFSLFVPPDEATRQVAIRGMRVLPRRDLTLHTTEETLAGRAGERVTFSVLVHNGGNCPDRVRLSAESVPDWSPQVEPAELVLGVGETVAARVSMEIPSSAREGTLQLLDLDATSLEVVEVQDRTADRDVVSATARVRTAVLAGVEQPGERYGRLPIALTFSAGSVAPGEESYAAHLVADGSVGADADLSLEANLSAGDDVRGAGGWQNQTLRARLRRGPLELTAGDQGVVAGGRLAPTFSGRGLRLGLEQGPWSVQVLGLADRRDTEGGAWSASVHRALADRFRLGADALLRATDGGSTGRREDRLESVHLTWKGATRSSLRAEFGTSRSQFTDRPDLRGVGAELGYDRTGRTTQLRARLHGGSRGFAGRSGDRDGALLHAAFSPGARAVRFWTNIERQEGGSWSLEDSSRVELRRHRLGLRLEPRHGPGFEVSAGEAEDRSLRADSLRSATLRRDLTFTAKLARGSFLAVSSVTTGSLRDLEARASGPITSWELSAGGRHHGFRAALRWSRSREWSLGGGPTRVSGWSADLSRELTALGAEFGISVGERATDTGAATGRGHDQSFVEPRLELRLGRTWSLRGEAAFDRIDGASRVARWRLSLHHAARDLLPIPWVALRGGLEGVAFVDLDGDGLPGGAEPRVADVVVRADGRSLTTDRYGAFAWPDLEPGTYWVEVDRGSVPPAYQLPVELPIEVELRAGHDAQVWIALRPCGGVTGSIFLDENRNGIQEPDERGLSDLRITLYREDVAVAATITDGTGRFALARVPAGAYELRADADWLPSGWVPTSEESGTRFVVGASERRELPPYGLAPRRKPMVITFSPR